ncbi:MAG TPA: extracellular solute-binding protein, partial [Aggregatilineales bacterium]|nr:extracellular solute-binding protein [Aggregatilineales bacterium]
MSFRRLWLFLAIVFLPLTTVYGAVSPQRVEAKPDSRLQQTTTTLNVWAELSPSDPPELVDLIKSIGKDFEGQHAGVTVNFTFEDPANLRDDLKKAVANGTPPDIADTGARWVPEFVSLGFI